MDIKQHLELANKDSAIEARKQFEANISNI